MATQTFTTTYEQLEYENLLTKCMSAAIRAEISKLNIEEKGSKTIYTRQETAELLGISLPTLNEYTKQGIIAAYRLGYKVRYKFDDINQALIRIKTK